MKEYHWFKKCICILCLCLLLPSCTDEPTAAPQNNPTADSASVLSMSYSKEDSMNPFLSTGKDNRLLWPLLFLPLFENDNSFRPQPVMADTYEVTQTAVTLTLKSGQRTPDGTELSIADVLYSFRLAKDSPHYADQLSVFKDAQIGTRADVLVFSLNRPNAHACSLLTFPIVQYGTADNESTVPVGAGPYSLTTLNDGYCLLANPYYYDGHPQSAQINLVDGGDASARAFALKSSTIDCSFSDLSDGKIIRTAASVHKIPMTNLVFLGIRFDNEYLQNPNVRRAISAAADRSAIATHAFCTAAKPTAVPFHPDWYITDGAVLPGSTQAEVEQAEKLLSQTIVSDTDGTATANALMQGFTLELLYCSDNPFKAAAANQLKEQIEKTPIRISLVGKTNEEYLQAVEDGNYDLFLGEVMLTDDMDLSAFLYEGGALAYGIDTTALTCTEVYDRFRAGTADAATFLAAFCEDMPFIPLCMRSGIFHTSRLLKNEILCTPENLYKNICYWEK